MEFFGRRFWALQANVKMKTNHGTFTSCRQTLFGARVLARNKITTNRGKIAICRWTLFGAALGLCVRQLKNKKKISKKALILSSSENGVFLIDINIMILCFCV